MNDRNIENILSEPLLFNHWKHHQGFLLDFIKTTSFPDQLPDLKRQFRKIGNSTTDLYTGGMNLEEIEQFSLTLLRKHRIDEERRYLDWIRNSDEGYRVASFPDKSVWVFKIGVEERRFAHIHPGRNVPHTVRVKANVLKTAIAAAILAYHEHRDPLDIETVNEARRRLIDLDPVKFITLNQEIGRIIHHFSVELDLKTH